MTQTGGGHYSPIGGYHAARDLALVLDVARFKYPPHCSGSRRVANKIESPAQRLLYCKFKHLH